MSITRLWGATGTTSVAFGAHQAGDFLVAYAFRDGSTSAPTIPAGWIQAGAAGASTCWGGLFFKIAASSGETSGTWTSASRLSVVCYRPGGTKGLGIGAVSTAGASSTSVSYPALALAIQDGSSWVGGAAGHRSTNTGIENAPTGMTNVAAASGVDGTAEIAFHDTDDGVAAWSEQSVNVGGTSSGWRSHTFEIVERTVWNPRDKAPDAVLSSANTVVVSTGSSGNQYARGTVGRRDGDFVIRYIVGSGNSYALMGVATPTVSLTTSPSGGGKIGYRTSTPDGGSPDGRFYFADGSYTAGLPVTDSDDVLDLYISRSLGKAWVKINGVATTGDPDAKTGGYDITTGLTAGEALLPISGGDADWGWGYVAAEVTIDADVTGTTLASGWEPWNGIEAEGEAIEGAADLAEAFDTVLVAGRLASKGAATPAEASDTVSATGQLALEATAAIGEASDSLGAAGRLALEALGSLAEVPDTLAAAGEAQSAIAGSAALTETSDNLSAAAQVGLSATAQPQEAGDAVAAAGALPIAASVALLEDSDAVAAFVMTPRAASAIIFEDSDTLTAVGMADGGWNRGPSPSSGWVATGAPVASGWITEPPAAGDWTAAGSTADGWVQATDSGGTWQ